MQKVLDNLGPQLGNKDIEIAKLQAVIESKDEHIEQLQKMLRERQETAADTPSNGARVTPPAVDGAVGDNTMSGS